MTAHDPELHQTPVPLSTSATAPGQTYDFWPDATVFGDIESNDAQAVLDSSIVALMAPHHRVSGDKWEHVESTVSDLLNGLLAQHPVEKTKHGRTIVYADSKLTGKSSNGFPRAYRLKDKITAITAVTIDVDGTDKAETVRDRVIAMGLFAVIHTTHSHATKKTATGDRFRVIVFLERPYDLPTDKASRRQAVNEWESRYVGFAESLGLSDIDASGMRLQQIMHPPRRPLKDAEFKHFIVAGRALRVDDMPKGDPRKYKKRGPMMAGTKTDAKASGDLAILSDGFDVFAWWEEAAGTFLLTNFLDDLGWDDRGDAGDGRVILCPNDADHSDPGNEDDTGCWACEAEGGDHERFVIICQHDHCHGVHTWDMIKLIEESVLDGIFALPDGFDTLSELLCADHHYGAADGEETVFDPTDFGAVKALEIGFIGSVPKATRELKRVAADAASGDDDFAALYAGAAKAGSKVKVVEKLDATIRETFSANDAKRLKKRGAELLAEEQKAWGREQEEGRREVVAKALADPQPANLSLDIAEPLGDTVVEALGTLAHRYVLADVSGKFKVIRRPDLAALRDNGRTLKSILIAQSPEDFVKFHADRKVPIIDPKSGQVVGMQCPATEFLNHEKRKSGIVFEPDTAREGPNDFNLYAGRTLEPDPSASGLRIAFFIWDVVCSRRTSLFQWVMLWLAHMVQYPGEKPQSAIVVWGRGGCGKSTFGMILDRLSHPHCRTLDKSEHVVGRFAGEHLATTICAVCTEAAFAGDPKVARELKSLVTSTEIAAEPKGLSVMQLPSFLRLYFDSNSPHAVPIEGNGSERRYLVMKVAEHFYVDLEKPDPKSVAYWNALYAAINGAEMAGFLDALLHFKPKDVGLTWDAVRRPPATPERDGMRWQSLRPVQRAFAEMLGTGECVLFDGGMESTYKFDMDAPIRLPIAPLRETLGRIGNKHNANDTDPKALAVELFGETVDGVWPIVTTGRGVLTGKIDGEPANEKDVRWIEFPSRAVMAGVIEARFNRKVSD